MTQNPTLCGRCEEEKPITHVVKSDQIEIAVCADCAKEALKMGGGGVGDMTVRPIASETSKAS